MAFNNNIPQPTDQLSVSQGDLLGNFQAINTAFNLNHGNFNAPTQGMHNFVEMPVQNPVPVTGANEVGLYCQTSSFTGNPELVFSHQNGGGIAEFTSSLPAQNFGWTVLPSGIIIKWGRVTVPNSGAGTIFTIPSGGANGPAFTTFNNVWITDLAQGVAPNPFTVLLNAGFVLNQFTAIGYTFATGTVTAQTFIEYLAIGI